MDKQYKPLTPPDKKAYEPYIKPKYIEPLPVKSNKKFRRKSTKAKPLWRICEKCHNIISDNGLCDFCGHTSIQKIVTVAVL